MAHGKGVLYKNAQAIDVEEANLYFVPNGPNPTPGRGIRDDGIGFKEGFLRLTKNYLHFSIA